jgi:hypothetical protein
MFLGSKVWRVRRADKLTAICEPLSRQCGILNISQPYRPPRPVRRDYFTLLYLKKLGKTCHRENRSDILKLGPSTIAAYSGCELASISQ